MHTTERSGSVFIRTDQLDGETDWKLRKAVNFTQSLQPIEHTVRRADLVINALPPNDQIYDFKGNMQSGTDDDVAKIEPLSLENTLWQNTVLASSGFVVACIVYTGKETRAEMNAKSPTMKFGKLDEEVNTLSKFLFAFMVVMSFVIVALQGFVAEWYVQFFRFVLLLSSIIPISLRVNLDLAKIIYCIGISKD